MCDLLTPLKSWRKRKKRRKRRRKRSCIRLRLTASVTVMMFIFIFRVFNRIRDGAGRQAGRVSFRSRLMQQLKLVEFM